MPDHVQQLADLKRALDHAAIVATTGVTGRMTYVNGKFVEINDLMIAAGCAFRQTLASDYGQRHGP